MEQSQITTAIRRGLREPKAVSISDSEIEKLCLRAVKVLGNRIKTRDPSFYNTRVSIASTTHVFSMPSDCLSILRVWDLGGTAGTVTAVADDGSGGIQVTITDHGFVDDDIVFGHSVEGCTEANGSWKITEVDDDNFTLNGSTFTNTYTSGGKFYEEPRDPDPITKINLSEATNNDETKWYPRGSYIVVDDPNFTNDILVDYVKNPSAITDVPDNYHEGLVSLPVLMHIKIPAPEHKQYDDLVSSKNFHQEMWKLVKNDIDQTYKQSSEPDHIPEEMDWDAYA
jgi:hypothetical protein